MRDCVWCLCADFVGLLVCLLVSKRLVVTRVHYSICLLVRLWLVVLLVIRSVFEWLFVWPDSVGCWGGLAYVQAV